MMNAKEKLLLRIRNMAKIKNKDIRMTVAEAEELSRYINLIEESLDSKDKEISKLKKVIERQSTNLNTPKKVNIIGDEF